MTLKAYIAAKNAAISLANIVSPSEKEQTGFVKLINEIEKDGDLSDNERLGQFVNAITDGLLYGNWPL